MCCSSSEQFTNGAQQLSCVLSGSYWLVSALSDNASNALIRSRVGDLLARSIVSHA